MFKKIEVKKSKKAHLDDAESIHDCKYPRTNDKNGDMLPVVKCKKKKMQLESTGEDLTTLECDSNATTSVEYHSKKKLKRKKTKLGIVEVEMSEFAPSINDDCTPKQNLDVTDKMSKKNKIITHSTADDDVKDVNSIDDEKVVALKNEHAPVDDTQSKLNVKTKRKKKKKKNSHENEVIINEDEYKELDEFIGELDEESNAQYDNWVKQIDNIFK